MQSTLLTGKALLRSLALTAVTLAPLLASATAVHAAPQIRVVACHLSSLSEGAQKAAAAPVDPIADSGSDLVEEDQQPKISGSIAKPANISEDDSQALAPYATLSRDDALTAARAALANPDDRKFGKGAVEGENGVLVWAIPTTLRSGASGDDKDVEVKVDAGTGAVLSIECD